MDGGHPQGVPEIYTDRSKSYFHMKPFQILITSLWCVLAKVVLLLAYVLPVCCTMPDLGTVHHTLFECTVDQDVFADEEIWGLLTSSSATNSSPSATELQYMKGGVLRFCLLEGRLFLFQV